VRVIGIDAGGTKTLGVLMDEREEILTRAQAGGSNIRSVGNATAERNLADVLRALLAQGDVRAVCVGAAGVGREDDRRQFLALLHKHVPAGIVVDVRNDANIILRAATPVRPAMVVIAGTGSAVYGEGERGSARAGGYGAVIGDPGSGYAIGLAALRATAEALDAGTQSGSVLATSILAALSAASVGDLVHTLHRWPPDVARIASLSKEVGRAHAAGDPDAGRIVSAAAEELATLFRIVERRVRGADGLPVVLSGGAFEAIPALAEELRARADSAGDCDFIRMATEPARGAALLGLDLLRKNDPGFRPEP
jgi:N-acetylmuramic acid 6-phosphate etherase